MFPLKLIEHMPNDMLATIIGVTSLSPSYANVKNGLDAAR